MTKADTKAPAERMAARPVRGRPERRAAEEEKASGAPLPRARRVTAAMEGERRRRDEMEATAGEKWAEAARTRREKWARRRRTRKGSTRGEPEGKRQEWREV